ncbi:transcription-repair coupling factor [Microbacterium sp. EYE_5]|uniref:transcription-repair coupling factor n=1 Tax=unclassified Microbacterium TaxID=2609290 RepID=UPI002003FB26|nr:MULTISPECIES: transcription-repair coupling factor [unclassified Microbacterium]MCK6081123.1 transcription-repair coupling factor [Microbacterium sp. EYE_382]MCK6086393.1 transcription-repair coupling factor [Microbacterium sp. EYE_384]MCK6124109.1 transcription-repair coupling factor [Microbacterium sp. EYE_80]MCK6127018.1 transcription-repair coupling factor [Microbacterium sp. EYE_79]MCK6142078.1 transcription-repair coupling factor [Microbacterium sp. EYE_39]
MTIPGIVRALEQADSFREALDSAALDADFSAVTGIDAPLLAGLLERRVAQGRPPVLLLVAPTGRRAESIGAALQCLLPTAIVRHLPAWETLPHERLSPSAETVGRRLSVLREAAEWDGRTPLVITASVRGALQPIAAGLTDAGVVQLDLGSRGHELDDVVHRLVELAYHRVDMVSRRGEFAVRGGILDVFPPVADHPYRVDFFGDEIDQIRAFSVADQRSLPGEVRGVTLLPSRELLLTDSVRERAAQLRDRMPGLGTMLEKMSEGIPVEGMESLLPAVADAVVPLVDYLPEGSAIAVVDPERAVTRAMTLADTNREFLEAAWSAATAGADSPVHLGSGDFLTLPELRAAAKARGGVWWSLSAFDSGAADAAAEGLVDRSDAAVRVSATAVPSFHGNVEGATAHIADLLGEGWRVVIAASGSGLVDRSRDVLSERGLAARAADAVIGIPDAGVAVSTIATLEAGFQIEEAGLAVFTESDFYGRTIGGDNRVVKKLASRRRNVVDPLQLQPGDHVVHSTHGIGRFVELVQREVSSGGRNPVKSTREYLVLEYAPSKRGHPGDKLFVPTDQLDLLSRYVGGEAPQLSKMGGSDWAAAKGKARKAVRDIAVELVKLYSARMASKGYAFGPDTPWQRELEEAFPFAETPDQLQTIDEIKADMEKPIPMDRLLSGDVGFGKTEVAVRAAFKAIQEGKQVAMLVPTTLLVKQHLETFAERFAGFPVKVRPLSRFQSDKEARETLAGITDGSVDMVIGTHRILTEKVAFKDLGLMIIDEEQRFGVEHKDALKKLKTNVDILAMSATPIPRTLEMAVTGIREMSTLATPPEERHPILTYVGPRSDKQIAAAIRRELLREGQVFFVHNRVSSIQRVAAQLAELVPEARIAVAHGQMGEHALEQVVDDFWERRADVLVSTTIIETGLDIANANTMIIDRADKYGLSQLHQLRGRVGRARERAYAYFLYDENKPLSETAADRLETIAVNNDLGSGMQVALKDLEIRGAGNLLGAEQAGHIAGVGFDLYLRMIGEAVATFRGEDTEGPTELRLELPVQARIPESYIDSERLRLEAYQKLSAAASVTAVDDAIDLVLEELTDRYGAPPAEVKGLIAIARLRRRAARSGLSDVVAMGPNLRIAPAHIPDSIRVRLQRLHPKAKIVQNGDAMVVPLPSAAGQALADADLIAWTGQLLDQIFPLPAKEAADA